MGVSRGAGIYVQVCKTAPFTLHAPLLVAGSAPEAAPLRESSDSLLGLLLQASVPLSVNRAQKELSRVHAQQGVEVSGRTRRFSRERQGEHWGPGRLLRGSERRLPPAGDLMNNPGASSWLRLSALGGGQTQH